MARKVFISILGTGFYGTCKYFAEGFIAEESRFVQMSTLEWIGAKNWTAEDTALFFLTDKARSENWEKSISERMNPASKANEPYSGLEKCLEELNLPFAPQGIDIVDGKDEKEIWQIFETIYAQLKENDELYIDLTHSFRYLPMLLLVLSNYAKFLKNVSVVHVSYGNYETRDKDTNEAPFVNLLPIVELQNITSVASNFVSYGRIENISKILFGRFEDKKLNGAIQSIKKSIDDLDDYILTNRMIDIKSGKYVALFQNNLKTVYKSTIPEPEKIVLKRLEDEMKDFVPKESDQNIIAAIDWAYKYNMLAQTYTLAQEYIITLVSNVLKQKNPFPEDKEKIKNFRSYINSMLAVNEKDVDNRNYNGLLGKFEQLSDELLSIEWVQQLRKEYKLLSDNRNIINHAKGTASAQTLKEQFLNSYKKSINILKSIS